MHKVSGEYPADHHALVSLNNVKLRALRDANKFYKNAQHQSALSKLGKDLFKRLRDAK